jgi:hypothetical protein
VSGDAAERGRLKRSVPQRGARCRDGRPGWTIVPIFQCSAKTDGESRSLGADIDQPIPRNGPASTGAAAQTAAQSFEAGRSSTMHLSSPCRSMPRHKRRRGNRGGRDAARLCGTISTLIRHASRGATFSVRPLAIAMVETTPTQLMATVGPPHLSPALLTSARRSAVAVPSETPTTHKEHRAAAIGPATLLETGLARGFAPGPAGRTGHGRPSHAIVTNVTNVVWRLPFLGATTETPIAANGRGFFSPPAKRTD